MDRRRFLAGIAGAVAAAAGVLYFGLRGRERGAPSVAPRAPVVPRDGPLFPDRYRDALRAMVERILPEEPDRPGAKSAGAYDYIERELRRPEMAGRQRLLLRGAVQLDRVAVTKLQQPFVKLTPEQQDTVIQALQSGEGAERRFEPKEFIGIMVALTLEGMFSDPVHGGNRDGAGWRSIGWVMQHPQPSRPW